MAILVSAVNVFFRDLGNVVRPRAPAVVVPLSGPVQPVALERPRPSSRTRSLARSPANPFAVLFESYRAVIYGSAARRPPHSPDLVSLRTCSSAASFLGVGIVVLQAPRADFAKVL